MRVSIAKQVVKRLVLRSRVLSHVSTLGPRGVVILRYHSIRENPERHSAYLPGIMHSVQRFEDHMRLLASAYTPVTMDDVVRFAEEGAQIPQRAVAVTFDDGFADNLEVAAPVMNRYGIKAAVYVSVGFIETGRILWFVRLRNAFDKTTARAWNGVQGDNEFDLSQRTAKREAFLEASRACAQTTGEKQEALLSMLEHRLGEARLDEENRLMLTWAQIRALHEQGHIVGSHTMTHPNLAHVALDEVVRELNDSKRIMETNTQFPIDHFSYPKPILVPYFTEQTSAKVRLSGYRTAVTCEPGRFRSGDDVMRISRISAPEDVNDLKWVLDCTLGGITLK
jgi:peptidoglycan/xylan/chitin deacetylase (PgdA/CDA1 family)